MQTLKNAILKLFIRNNRFIGENVKHKYPDIVQQIINTTSFLPANAKLAERCYCIVHNISSLQLCEYCNKQPKRFVSFSMGYKRTCSETCARKLANKRNNNLVKFNAAEHSKQKLLNLPCNKDGKFSIWTQVPCIKLKIIVATYLKTGEWKLPAATKQSRQKAQQTELSRYGRRSIDIISSKKFWIENFGVENPSQLEHVRKKLSQNNAMHNWKYRQKAVLARRKRLYKELQADNNIQLLSTFKEYVRGGLLKWKCLKCNTVFEKTIEYRYKCPHCFPDKTSNLVNKIVAFLRTLNVSFELHNRSEIKPYELDIFIRDKRLAIEVHGIYWHSELSNTFDKYAHKNKADMCEEKGIQLLQFFEDEILEKWTIVCSIIKHKLHLTANKVYARCCQIKHVPNKVANQFLNENHLAGYAIGKHIGLYFNNELVQIITYARSRFTNHDIELVRIATKQDVVVVGGLSKLLKHIVKIERPASIVSYIDRRIGQPKALEQVGFRLLRITEPGYFWVDLKNRQRYHRQYMQKHKLLEMFDDVDESMSETEILTSKGWTRIWDAGHYVMDYLDRKFVHS